MKKLALLLLLFAAASACGGGPLPFEDADARDNTPPPSDAKPPRGDAAADLDAPPLPCGGGLGWPCCVPEDGGASFCYAPYSCQDDTCNAP